MPLFEYECRDCGRAFEAFVTAERTAGCPACGSASLTKLLSSPGMVGAGAGRQPTETGFPAGSCGAGGAGCACRAGAVN